MDESWRIRNGMNLPRRRSTDFTTKPPCYDFCDPDEFRDVFGGPPRSVFLRKYSGDFSSSFYDEVFRPADLDQPARPGRSLPAFQIPAPSKSGGAGGGGSFARREGFYDDIFGCYRRSRSRSESVSKSRSNCSSVLSSEDLSPIRPSVVDVDSGVSSFASKLRPINIPPRQSTLFAGDPRKQGNSGAACPHAPHPSYMEFQFTECGPHELYKQPNFGLTQPMPSPESINIAEPSSYRSVKISSEDFEIDSNASEISSIEQEPNARQRAQEQEQEEQQEDYYGEEEDADFLGSYVIEIGSDRREEVDEAVAVDDAIAWVKEKCRTQSTEKEEERPVSNSPMRSREYNETEILLAQVSKELKKWEGDQGTKEPPKDMTMELLEEDIKLWSIGKEGNIRSLLSTLQYILWPNSGWQAIPLSEMIDLSQVRKAYQRARLCLHPDKLQQKGATTAQKYMAEKIFTLLQDAWTEFNSQDVFPYS